MIGGVRARPERSRRDDRRPTACWQRLLLQARMSSTAARGLEHTSPRATTPSGIAYGQLLVRCDRRRMRSTNKISAGRSFQAASTCAAAKEDVVSAGGCAGSTQAKWQPSLRAQPTGTISSSLIGGARSDRPARSLMEARGPTASGLVRLQNARMSGNAAQGPSAVGHGHHRYGARQPATRHTSRHEGKPVSRPMSTRCASRLSYRQARPG